MSVKIFKVVLGNSLILNNLIIQKYIRTESCQNLALVSSVISTLLMTLVASFSSFCNKFSSGNRTIVVK